MRKRQLEQKTCPSHCSPGSTTPFPHTRGPVVVVVVLVVVVVAQPPGVQASQQLGTLPMQPPDAAQRSDVVMRQFDRVRTARQHVTVSG